MTGNDITAILTANHDFLVGENDLDQTAEEWVGLDLAGWLAADVFQACIARRFEAAGVTPAEVGDLEGWQVGDDECDRVGYAVANGDIRVEKAIAAVKANREIIADDCDDDEAATLHARALCATE